MHKRIIDLGIWADIYEEATDCGGRAFGSQASTSGKHPRLGCFVVIEDAKDAFTLVSQHPLTHHVSMKRAA